MRRYTRVPLAQSVTANKEGYYNDSGLAQGSSYRVGWGPYGKLVHIGALYGSDAPERSDVVTVDKLKQVAIPTVRSRPLSHESRLTSDYFRIPILPPSFARSDSSSPIPPSTPTPPPLFPTLPRIPNSASIISPNPSPRQIALRRLNSGDSGTRCLTKSTI